MQRSKYVTQVQQQRPEPPTVTLTWHALALTPLIVDLARALWA